MLPYRAELAEAATVGNTSLLFLRADGRISWRREKEETSKCALERLKNEAIKRLKFKNRGFKGISWSSDCLLQKKISSTISPLVL